MPGRGWRSIAGVLVLVTSLLVGLTPRATGDDGDGGLEHLATVQESTRVHHLRFRAPALAGETSARILLPDGYDPSGATRYPVLYLLHGGAGSSTDWLQSGNVEALTKGYPLIVVLPDGGVFGFYANWWSYGSGEGPQYETFHLEQLLPWIDAHYPTVASRDGRAVAGLSMGGLGAMHYAAKRPDLFTAVESFSGAIDTNLIVAPPIVEVASMAHDLHLPAAVFGPRLTEEVRWRGHNPVDLAANLAGLQISMDTGNGEPGDPVEGAMHQMAAAMHARLDDLAIDHRYNAYGAGCHCWPLWQRDLRDALPRLMQRFAHPAPIPSPFTYASIDPTYRMYGWRVAIDRPAVEFSELADAGPDGFSLTGSGDAQVRTAPLLFEPGQAVGVTIADAAGTARRELVADQHGRLTVPVSLGPGNPFQQLSPAGNLWAATTGAPPGTWPSVTATVTFSPPGPGGSAAD